MIAFLSDDRERYRSAESSQIARVRSHLRMVPRRRDTSPREWQLVSDLCSMMARLRRLQKKDDGFARVGISSHLRDAIKAIKMVGNELIVLQPERKGA